MKAVVKIIFSLFLAVFCCGCLRTTQPEERAIVQAAAIDYDSKQFTLTLQIFEPGSGGESTSTGSKYQLMQTRADSLTQAFEQAAQRGKEIYMGSCRVLLVGNGTSARLRSILEYCNSRPQTRATTLVACTPGRAADLLSLGDGNAVPSPADSIEQELTLACQEKRLIPCRIMDLMAALETDGRDCLLPALTVQGEKEKAAPVLAGAVVFRQEEPTLTLTLQELAVLGWSQRGEANLLLGGSNFSSADIYIEKLSPKIEVAVVDDSLRVKAVLNCSGRISEYRGGSSNRMTQQQIKELEQNTARQMEETFGQLLQKLCQAGCDPLRLGEHLRQSHPNSWQAFSNEWPQRLTQAQTTVECRCELTTFSDK